jgi:hypothetical protein
MVELDIHHDDRPPFSEREYAQFRSAGPIKPISSRKGVTSSLGLSNRIAPNKRFKKPWIAYLRRAF